MKITSTVLKITQFNNINIIDNNIILYLQIEKKNII